MSQANTATSSTPTSRSTANPRRTTLASVEDFGRIPGARTSADVATYATELPSATANPRRTQLAVAPVVNVPRD
ncbi:hypothetical protein ACFVFS_30915 [Kitasatospora sp. NPDC057692]|uniref:hypothetical protein n=1 Tax=Kitasatospora sp. NPDC057692 TaxID=3346215 RepID=UPI0036C12B5B